METQVADKQGPSPVRRRLPVLKSSSFAGRFRGASINHASTATALPADVPNDQEILVVVELENTIKETVIQNAPVSGVAENNGRCEPPVLAAVEQSTRTVNRPINKLPVSPAAKQGVESSDDFPKVSFFASKIQRSASLKKPSMTGDRPTTTTGTLLRRPSATLKTTDSPLGTTLSRKSGTTAAACQPCDAIVTDSSRSVAANAPNRTLKNYPRRSNSDVQQRVNVPQSAIKSSQPAHHSRLLPPTLSRPPANLKPSAVTSPRSAAESALNCPSAVTPPRPTAESAVPSPRSAAESARICAAASVESSRGVNVRSSASVVVLGPLSSQYLPSGTFPIRSSDGGTEIKKTDSSCSSRKSSVGVVAGVTPDSRSVSSQKASSDEGSPRVKKVEPKSVLRRQSNLAVEPSRLRRLSKTATTTTLPSSVATPGEHQTSAETEKRLQIKNLATSPMAKCRPGYFSHQPDLVTNSIHNEEMASKLQWSELQRAVLEKRLVELGRMLHQRSLGFEAMLALVKYLSEECSPVSVRQLKAQLLTAGDLLRCANTKCDVLVKQRNALISEIQNIKEDHEVQINALNLTHEMAIRSIDEHRDIEIKKRQAEDDEKHKMAIEALTMENARVVNELMVSNKREIAQKEQEINSRLIDLEFSNKRKLSEIQRKHDGQVKAMSVQFEQTKSYLTAKVEQLKIECESLQRHHVAPPSVVSLSTDEKSSTSAEAEIASLRTVLDLRNAEISKLKLANTELEKQAKELVTAHETIQRLQQKLENAEAIVSMKVDYERELAEKHVMLLRMYDQESKDNKRLSLNNEQLMWRLSQDGVGQAPLTPTVARRTVSSAASARRRAVLSSESGHRPLSQTDFDGFTAEDFVTSEKSS